MIPMLRVFSRETFLAVVVTKDHLVSHGASR
jgi:hypothetical protein